MGRHYNGDINGKFWFAIQASNDGDYFGVIGKQPEVLKYHYYKTDLPNVLDGINNCESMLGEKLNQLDHFFNHCREGFNELELIDSYNWTKEETDDALKWYARLRLGMIIRECIIKNGECQFTAEL